MLQGIDQNYQNRTRALAQVSMDLIDKMNYS
jgi:hypothetical protein